MNLSHEEFVRKGIVLILKGIAMLLWHASGLNTERDTVRRYVEEYNKLDLAKVTRYVDVSFHPS